MALNPPVSIFIESLIIPVLLGVDSAERQQTQLVEFTIEFIPNNELVGHNDNLEETVDYAAVVAVLKKTVSGHEFRVIEYLAGICADAILESCACSHVSVRVRKKNPLPEVVSTSVIVIRTQDR